MIRPNTESEHDLAILDARGHSGWWTSTANPHRGPTTSSTPTPTGGPTPTHYPRSPPASSPSNPRSKDQPLPHVRGLDLVGGLTGGSMSLLGTATRRSLPEATVAGRGVD